MWYHPANRHSFNGDEARAEDHIESGSVAANCRSECYDPISLELQAHAFAMNGFFDHVYLAAEKGLQLPFKILESADEIESASAEIGCEANCDVNVGVRPGVATRR